MLSPRAARDRNNVIQYLRPRREQDHRGKGLCGVLTASNPSDLGHAERLMYGRTNLAFRFLTAVDVEGFSRRPTAEQAKIQDDLEFAISTAASRADLDRRRWYRQPRGDGELAVLPQGVNGLSLVADYPRSLAVVLGEINRSANPGSRLRIRVAIHHGAVFPGGPFGPVGAAPILVSRLVDAQVLRHELAQRKDADIALMVSPTVYEEIVQSRLHDLDPETFCRTVIKAKGSRIVGYLAQNCLELQHPRVSSSNAAHPAPTVPVLSTRARTPRRRRGPPLLAENDLAMPAGAQGVHADPGLQLMSPAHYSSLDNSRMQG